MANTAYHTAGFQVPKNSGQSAAANTAYHTAGYPVEVLVAAGGIVQQAIMHLRRMRAK